jgi:membrane protein
VAGVRRFTGRLPQPVQSVLRVGVRTVRDSFADRVPGLAAEAAFFAVLSLPPLLLAVLGGIGFAAIEVEGVVEVITDLAGQVLRDETVQQLVEPAVRRLLEDGQGEVFSLGVVLALWSGSRATSTYITAVTIAYDIEDPRPPWRLRLLAFLVTVVGAVLGVVLLPALVLGPALVTVVTPTALPALGPVVVALYWLGVGLGAVAMVASFYHVAVPWHTPWRRDLPGALLAMALWMIGSYGLRYYADITIRGEGSVYTGIAAPLVVLLWLYVTAMAVLLGAELNAEIEKLWPHERQRTSREVSDFSDDGRSLG